MTALDTIREWLNTYPGHEDLQGFHVDYTDRVPNNGGLFPSGLVEIQRRKDILGNISVTNQYNFALYYVFAKAAGDDEGAAVNADWVMDFQLWVQAQSVCGLAPKFGDDPRTETVSAQNGVLFENDEAGVATYAVQVSVQFTKRFEV